MSLAELKNKLIQGVRATVGVVSQAVAKLPKIDRRFHVADRLNGPWVDAANEVPHLWLHGASFGECKMLCNLAKRLKIDLDNGPRMLLTTQKAELLSVLKELGREVFDVALAPADVPSAMEKFVRNVHPVGLILGENELWPGYLSSMSRVVDRPSVALVSGRYRKSFPGMDFSSLGYASMQTDADRTRLMNVASKANLSPMVGGDWKLLPWVFSCKSNQFDDNELSINPESKTDVVFLSVHFEEWKSLVKIIRFCKNQRRSVVLMPRRLEEVELFRRELDKQRVATCVWPLVAQGAVSLVDKFGCTEGILKNSSLAVVGGSFCLRPGIHDFWEPLRAMVPTCVGPYAYGHEDVVKELVSKGVVARIKNASDFENLDLPGKDRIRLCLDSEKSKIMNSYQQLLQFLKELLQ